MHDIILIWVLSWIALFTAVVAYGIVYDWTIILAEKFSIDFILWVYLNK